MDKSGIAPTISVVMAVYNAQPYLAKAVESIIGQTFQDFELIIIDDGSTDGSTEDLQRYAATNNRIRLFVRENRGLTKSLNEGLKLVRGQYVARHDADDFSAPDRFQIQVDFLNKNESVSVVGSYAALIDDNGKEIGILKPPCRSADVKEGLRKGNCFCHGSIMAKTSDLIEVGGYREYFEFTQDFDLWLRISKKYNMFNIDKILYYNRRSKKTISRKNLSRQFYYHLLAIELYNERRNYGMDSLEINSINDPYILLTKKYNFEKKYINKLKSERYFKIIAETIKNNRFECLKYAFFAIKNNFSIFNIKRLMRVFCSKNENI